MTYAPADFETLRASHPLLGQMSQSLQSFFKLLIMCKNTPRGMQNAPLIARMANANINAVLGTSVEHNLDVEGPNFVVEVVKLWISSTLNAVTYVHEKSKMGLFLYARINSLNVLMTELRNDYQRLLASLSNRSDVNELAMFVAGQLQHCIAEARAYAEKRDERRIIDALQFLTRYRANNAFSIRGNNGLEDVAARNAFLTIHHYKADFNALTEVPISEYQAALDPILQGIRSFVPTPKEAALEQARNLKPTAMKLGRDIQIFLDTDAENKSLGGARNLKSSLQSMKNLLDNLVPHGIILDEFTTGLTAMEMATFMADLDDYISQRESQIRQDEAQSRAANQELSKSAPQLKLPDLHGFSSYLSWKAAADELLPLHQNELVKRQLVKGSLKNKEDILRCKDVGFKAMMQYLELRYSSSLLIPALIEEACKLRKAHDEKSSYDNLTSFVALLNQLRAHKEEHRLTMHIRQKLAPILLHNVNLSMFYRDIGKKEQELKRLEEQAGEAPDGASVVSYALGDEYEDQRRAFWIEEILSYLNVVRKIVSQQQTEPHTGKYRHGNKNYSITQEPSCPVCRQQHVNANGVKMTALTKCPQWQAMTVKQRYAAVKQYSHCVRCTRPKADPGHHGKGCSIADQMNLVCNQCTPASRTHHPLLHDPDLAKSAAASKPVSYTHLTLPTILLV